MKPCGRDIFVDPLSGPVGFDSGATHRPGAPVLCTEFGGVNVAPAGGDQPAGEKDWGYHTASDSQDLLRRVESMIMGITKGGQCCGFVYTQL